MDFRWSVLEFVEECQRSSEDPGLMEKLRKLGASLGFEGLSIVNLWQVQDTIRPAVRATTFTPEFIEHYVQQKYDRDDPLWQAAVRAQRAFRWGEAWGANSERRVEKVRELYREVGMVDGLTIPVVNKRSQKSFVAFGSDRLINLPAAEESMLALAAIVFRGSLGARYLDRDDTQPCRSKLTVREREILSWTAAGKSAWEISTILHLSEATVARHLLNIRAKLKAANTVQAVAEAIRLNEIAI